MFGIDHLVGLALCGLAVVAAGFTLAAASSLVAHRGRPSRAAAAPPVTLLKPLHLAEPELEENLRSFLRQDYAGPIQIIFGAQSKADPALATVQNIIREFPEADISIVSDPGLACSNPKVANLVSMVVYARHEVLVLSDSDIRVTPDYLRHVTQALEEPGVGAVSCFYAGKPAGNVWSQLAAMGTNYHFMPNACLGIALQLTQPCFGSTIALRRRILKEIGGFESLSNVLADDYELGRAVREAGYRVFIPKTIAVEHVCGQASMSALFRQELRWARTNLVLAKASYAGMLLTYPLPLALLALLVAGPNVLTGAVLALALASRLCLVFQSRRFLHLRGGDLWLLPLRDVLSFAVFVASFFGHTVDWRGTRYVADANGALAQLEGA